MKLIRKLPQIELLKQKYSLSEGQIQSRKTIIKAIEDVLSGKSNKKILIIGPCSADCEDSVLVYMSKIAEINEQIKDKFVVVPRLYTSKPRTNGQGYKGLIHRPKSTSEFDDIFDGISIARKLHTKVICETGLYCADEILYSELHSYINDLLAYSAVGARSVENQQHRLVASGLDMPVGMKNPTSGDNSIMLNAIYAAQLSHKYAYQGYECESEGNPYAHGILRGFQDKTGAMHPNYHYEDVCQLFDDYQKKKLKNQSVIIDCNHGNSRKNHDEQIRISKEVINICNEHSFLNNFIKGLMIESYLVDGRQMIGENIFGKSITDSCLGWSKTERLLLELAEIINV